MDGILKGGHAVMPRPMATTHGYGPSACHAGNRQRREDVATRGLIRGSTAVQNPALAAGFSFVGREGR